MADRPKELEVVERFDFSARLNHQEAFRVHRQLVELDADTEHARDLFAESVTITLTQMPAVTDDMKALAREWSEVNLLDPAKAEWTARQIRLRFAELAPTLEALTARQDEIIAELVRLLRAARGS